MSVSINQATPPARMRLSVTSPSSQTQPLEGLTEQPAAAWKVQLLDGFHLSGPSGEVRLTARKAIALLAYLTLQANHSASRETLATLLWEDVDIAQGRVSLRQSLTAIRKIEADHPPLILADADTVRLSPDVDADVWRFAKASAGSPQDRQAAADLYRSDPLSQFVLRDAPAFNEWLAIEQARLRQAAVSVFSGLIDLALAASGDLNAGIQAALRLLTLDPFNEIGHRGLMAIYARQGRAALAIQQYRSLVDLLRRDLQIAPEAQTQQLYAELNNARRRAPAPTDQSRGATSPGPEQSSSESFDVIEPQSAPQRRRLTKPILIGSSALLALCLVVGVAAFAGPWRTAKPPHIQQLFSVAEGPDWETTPAVSPNGLEVVFTRRSGQTAALYVTRMDGAGEPTKVTASAATEDYAAWRPDGGAIAFTREVQGGAEPCEIIIKPMPNGVEQVIGRCLSKPLTRLTWSADAKALFIVDAAARGGTERIYRFDLAAQRATPITNPPTGTAGDSLVALSHDGQRLVFQRQSTEDAAVLTVHDLRSGKEHEITDRETIFWGAVWTKDDRGIAFSGVRDGEDGLWWVDSRGRTDPVRLSPGVLRYGGLSYAQDRERLVFEAARSQTTLSEIGPDARLPATPQPSSFRTGLLQGAPSESVQGDLVFVSARSGQSQLWLAKPGEDAQQLTRTEGVRYQSPAWSPDGQWVAVVGVSAGRAEIYLISRSGGPPRRLTRDGREVMPPTWSRDGRHVYFGSRRDGEWRVWRVAVDGPAQPTPVTGRGPWMAREAGNGDLIYMLAAHKGLWRQPLTTAGQLSGRPVRMVDDLQRNDARSWFVVGDTLVYARRLGSSPAGTIRRYDLSSGATTDLADATRLNWAAAFTPRPQGGLLLVQRDLQIDLSGMDLD